MDSDDQSSELAPVAVTKDLITVVIPAFNEEEGIAATLRKTTEELEGLVAEIIVVDDGSSDRTAQVAGGTGVRVIRHPNNRGYGASLKTGIRAASTEFVLTMDADGQHRAEDVSMLCRHIAEVRDLDLLVGNRTNLDQSPAWRMPGKWVLTTMAKYLTRRSIPDLNSGLRVLRRETALKYISLCPQGFSFSTTMTMAMLSRGHQVKWLPIHAERRIGTSTVSVRTGFETIMLILRLATLFNPLRIFLPASGFCVASGVLWGVPHVLAEQGVTVAAMLAIVLGVLFFALGLISDQIAQLRLERYE